MWEAKWAALWLAAAIPVVAVWTLWCLSSRRNRLGRAVLEAQERRELHVHYHHHEHRYPVESRQHAEAAERVISRRDALGEAATTIEDFVAGMTMLASMARSAGVVTGPVMPLGAPRRDPLMAVRTRPAPGADLLGHSAGCPMRRAVPVTLARTGQHVATWCRDCDRTIYSQRFLRTGHAPEV